jgi:hypothetical protein
MLAAAVLFVFAGRCSAVIIADWTFESTPLTPGPPAVTVTGSNVGPYTAESGVNAGSSQATGFHATAATVWSAPAGNGSVKSLSANQWLANDYFQFFFDGTGTGFPVLTLSVDQTGSATGPKSFKVATSTDGTTFADLPGGGYSFPNPPIGFTPATNNPLATFTFVLPSSMLLSSTDYVRLIDTSPTTGGAINSGNVGTAGTGRVDNVILSAVPEASSALFGAMVCGVIGVCYGSRALLRRKVETTDEAAA